MKYSVDILIINNAPTFYKINLYNELAKYCKIHVVFIAYTNQVVVDEAFEKKIYFSFEMVSNIQIEKRRKWKSLSRLFSIYRNYNYKKIIYGGYDDLEQRILMFLTPKTKNCLQFESSIRESRVSGLVRVLKKIILSRITIALPAGKLQKAVFDSLGFKGIIIETKGVGIFNKPELKNSKNILQNSELKYIYVGRLISVKNLEFIIDIFNKLNKPLTIVGTGYLESALRKRANSNIIFTGFVPNELLSEYYTSHDIFILPSVSETWGLVIEEAIYFGLPVLVSDAVGCQEEMVLAPKTGVVFTSKDEISLMDAIKNIELNISYYRHNCTSFDFVARDIIQIKTYLKILSV